MAMSRGRRERRFLARQERSWQRTIAAMSVRLGESDPASLLARTNQTVDRLAVLVESASAQFSSLSEEQRSLGRNPAHLDEVIDSGEEPPDWLEGRVEIRRIGHGLNAEGGAAWMVAVAERAHTLRGVSLRVVEMYWEGIGGWRS